MLARCYGGGHPTYLDCEVDERWWNYQVFAAWFYDNYVEGFHLDKDLLVEGNRIYSPETCLFVTPQLNTLFWKGGHGVRRRRGGSFRAVIKLKGQKVKIGTYKTVQHAARVYRATKVKEVRRQAMLKSTPAILVPVLLARAERMMSTPVITSLPPTSG